MERFSRALDVGTSFVASVDLAHSAVEDLREAGAEQEAKALAEKLVQELAREWLPPAGVDEAVSDTFKVPRLWRPVLDEDVADRVQSVFGLARLYARQGKINAARALYRRALDITKTYIKTFGEEHPATIPILTGLAGLYRFHSRSATAKVETLYKRALDVAESSLSPDHAYVTSALNNLASLYNDQKRYAEAEQLFQRALAATEESLGPSSPELADILNNLGHVYFRQGRYAEVEPLLQRALMIVRSSLGADHPNTKVCSENHAAVLRAIDRGTETKSL